MRRRIRLTPAARVRALAGRVVPRTTFDRRSAAVHLVFAVVVLLTVAQLVHVQVVDAEHYATRSLDQRDEFLTLPADRGRLYDRTGEVLAASIASASVWVNPSAFAPGEAPDGTPRPPAEDPTIASGQLAAVLGLDVATVRRALGSDGEYVWLARQMDAAVADRVADLDLNGVHVVMEPRRSYPAGALAGQVLGTTDVDGVGLGGMELQHDDLLVGQPGWLAFERGDDGAVIPSGTREAQAPVPGTDLVLTIDRQLQYTAERVAAETVEATGALGASIIVLEVGTGEVLAMASAPTVDLNDRAGMDETLLRNRAVTDNFEPGSVQKAITAAAAIEEGVVTPDTLLEVADSIEVGGKVFTDAHEHETEEMTFAEVIESSSNVGTIMVAEQLGEERLADWLTRFGYGRPVELGFPGEAAGLVRPVEEWWGTSLPTIAIGQGVAVTLVQAANAYATIANDGVAVPPTLVRGTVDADGVLQPLPRSSGQRVLSPDTAAQVRAMLAGVVHGDGGTGTRAAIDGYTVAGKTGTARKPRTDGRGYSGEYIASFVGMAPADDPQVVVAVMVDEPRPIYGGLVAAPDFAEVAAEALRRANVPVEDGGASFFEAERTARQVAARTAYERAVAEEEAERARSSTNRTVGRGASGR